VILAEVGNRTGSQNVVCFQTFLNCKVTDAEKYPSTHLIADCKNSFAQFISIEIHQHVINTHKVKLFAYCTASVQYCVELYA
jgi:hypothetical protein